MVEEEHRHVYNRDNECSSGSSECWSFKSMWSSRLYCGRKLAQNSWM